MRFEIYKDWSLKNWRWRLRHKNGNIIACSGEGYRRKGYTIRAIKNLVRGLVNRGEMPEIIEVES